jgi:hypothetical protein
MIALSVELSERAHADGLFGGQDSARWARMSASEKPERPYRVGFYEQ